MSFLLKLILFVLSIIWHINILLLLVHSARLVVVARLSQLSVFGKRPISTWDAPTQCSAGLFVPDVCLAEEADTLVKPRIRMSSGAADPTSYRTDTHMACTRVRAWPSDRITLRKRTLLSPELTRLCHLVSPGTPSRGPATQTNSFTLKSLLARWWRCVRWTGRRLAGTTSQSWPWRWVSVLATSVKTSFTAMKWE